MYLAKNYPLPITGLQTLFYRIILSFLASLFVLIPLCYIPAAFVSFVVKERSCKSKHLQIVSSVSTTTYWISTYIWDMMLYTLLSVFIMLAFLIYGQGASQSFIADAKTGAAVFLLLWMYGAAVLPLCYLYSHFFENHSTCQITVTVINFTTGCVLLINITAILKCILITYFYSRMFDILTSSVLMLQVYFSACIFYYA